MKDIELERAVVAILWNLGDVFIRESVLTSETEIRLRRGLAAADFRAAIDSLRSAKLLAKDVDPYGEALYSLTPAGREAARRA